MPTIQDNAVCLRLRDWSETSQIVQLMTERHGKIAATAKGAKRRQPATLAKFSGGIELLGAGGAVLIVKRGTELSNLIEWDLVDAHWHLRRRLAAWRLAMYAADLVHQMVQDHDPHPETFRALRTFLADLAADDEAARQRALLRFQWDLVTDMGYRPVLDRDAETGEALDGRAPTFAFAAVAGGVVADAGRGREPGRWRVRRQTVELLRAVQQRSPAADVDAATLGRANRLMCVYCREILGRHLPTMDAVLGT